MLQLRKRRNVQLGWSALAKYLVILQPMAIASLMLERTPSLTRAATQDHAAAVVIAVVLLSLVAIAAGDYLLRHFFKLSNRPPRWMPNLLIVMAAVVGSIGAMSLSGAVVSPTLVILYLGEAIGLLWCSYLTQQEITEAGNA